jgi:hypothetical protein
MENSTYCTLDVKMPLGNERDLAGIDLVSGDRQDDVARVNEAAEYGYE